MNGHWELEPECAESWPEASSGSYNPQCCRFPKSCSAQDVWVEDEPQPTTFQPGDRVRHRHGGIGTVVPNTDPHLQTSGVTCVDMDREDIPNGLYFRTDDLRLAGTRCIPFEAMTWQQQVDHLTIAHRIPIRPHSAERRPLPHQTQRIYELRKILISLHDNAVAVVALYGQPIPHTHRKEPRT